MISQSWQLEQKLTLELVFKEDERSENVNVLKALTMFMVNYQICAGTVTPVDFSDNYVFK